METEGSKNMKKTIFSLAAIFTIIAFSNIAMAGPYDGMTYHERFNTARYNDYARSGPHMTPPPPAPHHHHHPAPPPPPYYGYGPYPIMPANQIISVNYPNASYYYSTPYYGYPAYNNYYYPNKTLTVRTKHVLFSI